MSYKTNPIFNRLKVNKGWKNPYLPTKTLNYSRDISLWFKVYLLLKLFLNLKKLQLLSCEIRFEQQNQKLLYLVINKKKTHKKKNKIKNFVLKGIQSPILKKMNKNSIFFLYRNLKFLKNFSFWNQNVIQKKVLSKVWLTKPKNSTLINTLEKITNVRQMSKKNCNFLKKNTNFIPRQQIKLKFLTIKQKQILAQKARIQKINNNFYAKLFELSQEKKSKLLLQSIINLQKRIATNKAEIQELNKTYEFLSFLNKSKYVKKNNKNFLKTLAFRRFQRQKNSILLKYLKKKIHSINRIRFMKNKFPQVLLKINKELFTQRPTDKSRFLKKEFLIKNLVKINFLIAQLENKDFLSTTYPLISTLKSGFRKKTIKKNISLANLQLQNFFKYKFNKTVRKKIFRSKFYQIYIWLLLSLKKKKLKKKKNKTLKRINRNFKLQWKHLELNKYISFWNQKNLAKNKLQRKFLKNFKQINKFEKKKQIVRNYQYRLPSRKLYFNFLQINTKLKLKYLIQDFVQKYFSLQIEAKIVHFLNTHKNQKYFRLVFPIWKKKKKEKTQKFRQKTWKQKKIFLASDLQVLTTTNNDQHTQIKLGNENRVKFLKKKDLYSLARKKIKSLRIQNNFKRIKHHKDFRQSYKYFITTLMYFSRTLEPQLLANLLAKVVYKAKKQTWMLNTIKGILKMIKLGKNVGYKIALAGRINSSDKSRLICITKKNVPLQVFDKNMNFAYSQAKARIGVFGIKIWVYF